MPVIGKRKASPRKNFLKVLATLTQSSGNSIVIAPLIARGNESKGFVISGELKSVENRKFFMLLFLTWTEMWPEITCQSSASEREMLKFPRNL